MSKTYFLRGMKFFLFAIVAGFLYSSVSASYTPLDTGINFDNWNSQDITIWKDGMNFSNIIYYVKIGWVYHLMDASYCTTSFGRDTYGNYWCYIEAGSPFTWITASDIYTMDATIACAIPAPPGWHYGTLTYNPKTINQAWTYGTSSCGYVCTDGYTGSGCSTPPNSPSNSNTLQDGLVANWTFDSCTATDDTTHTNDGWVIGNPKCVSGVKSNALKFEGIYSPDYVIIPNTADLAFNDNFTFSPFFRERSGVFQLKVVHG